MNSISVLYQTPFKTSIRAGEIKKLVNQIFLSEKKTFESVNIIFCSDAFLLEINQRFLNHKYYTDIITFNYNEIAIEGELYISFERLIDNARKHKVNIQQEIFRLIIHGTLHLCGYQDTTFREKAKMTQLEDFYLKSTNS